MESLEISFVGPVDIKAARSMMVRCCAGGIPNRVGAVVADEERTGAKG